MKSRWAILVFATIATAPLAAYEFTKIACGTPIPKNRISCEASGRFDGKNFKATPSFELDGCFPNHSCQSGQECYLHSGSGLLDSALVRTNQLPAGFAVGIDRAYDFHNKFLSLRQSEPNNGLANFTMCTPGDAKDCQEHHNSEKTRDWGYLEGTLIPALNSGETMVSNANGQKRKVDTSEFRFVTTINQQSLDEATALITERSQLPDAPIEPTKASLYLSRQTGAGNSPSPIRAVPIRAAPIEQSSFERGVSDEELNTARKAYQTSKRAHEKATRSFDNKCRKRSKEIMADALKYLCSGAPAAIGVPAGTLFTDSTSTANTVSAEGWHVANLVGIGPDPRPGKEGQTVLKLQDSASPSGFSYLPEEHICLAHGITAVLVPEDKGYSKGASIQEAIAPEKSSAASSLPKIGQAIFGQHKR